MSGKLHTAKYCKAMATLQVNMGFNGRYRRMVGIARPDCQ